jgi:hypothetical protein
MKTKQLPQIIRLSSQSQSEIVQNIRRFLLTPQRQREDGDDYMSMILHYSYRKEIIKISLGSHFQEHMENLRHKKNLREIPTCRILFKKGETEKSVTFWLTCKFLAVRKNCLLLKILEIK